MTDSHASEIRGESLQYQIGDALFGAMALKCLDKGWTVIPQERGERRRSSIVDGAAIKWGDFKENPPSRKEVQHWANSVPSANGAILLGKASGLTFALDIDVTDKPLASSIIVLADEIFGPTPFLRQGQAPKTALIYRVAREEDLPPNRSWRFVGDDGGASDQMLEIQGTGKLLTAFGYHHRTGKYFSWEGPQPGSHSTTDVPLVTPEQIELFISSVQDIRAFHRNGINHHSVEITGSSDGVRVPKYKLDDRFNQWVEDPTSGKVVDGREAFLWHISRDVVRGNAHHAQTEEGVAKLRAAVLEQFENRAEMSGKWLSGYVNQEIFDKVGRAVRDLREGRLKPYGAAALGLRKQNAPATSMKFLAIGTKKQQVECEIETIDDAEVERRKLNLDRDAVGDRTQEAIGRALEAAFDAVYDGRTEEVHVIPGATGTGKTSRAIQMVAEDPRTKSDDDLPADSEDRIGPWVMVLATYNNVTELKNRAEILGLDPNLDDDDLVKQAAARGVVLKDSREIERARQEAMDAGLRVEVYRGKLAAGCKMAEVVAPLMAAGIRTGQLCKTKKRTVGGEMETVLCDHYTGCPAILQRKAVKTAHLVILVQNFLTLSIPEELKKIRGVILDERIFHLVLHGTTMQLKTLSVGRREPKLTKNEVEAGISPLDLVQDRETAAEIAVSALKTGRDVANEFFDVESLLTQADCVLPADELASRRSSLRSERLARIESAKRVCGSAMAIEQAVYPMMTPTAVQQILDRPTGTEIAQEWRFWEVVGDRFEMLSTGTATGDRDSRIQYLSHFENDHRVRISWTDEMNWCGVTRILLDASIDLEITARLFPDSNVIVHEIETDLNLRVIYASDKSWAISGLVPGPETDPKAVLSMAQRVDSIRLNIARLAGLYAHGAILYVLPKSLRTAVQTDWQVPFNVDISHHGAIKGLDYARSHVAVVSLGRLEPPSEAIDAQVAAMTHRDAVPEKPIDALGTGVDADGRGVGQIRVPRRVKLRGKDVIVASTEYTGELARRLQEQYREEETRQIIGRLRPVYRPDTTEAIIIGQALPEDIVVDAITTFDSLQCDLGFWDLVRRCGGIIDVEAMTRRSPTSLTVDEVQALFDRLTDRDEVLKRYHRITSKSGDGRVSQWYLPGYFSDDEAEVRAYAQSCAPNDTILTVGLSSMTVIPAGRAPVDAISEAYGDAVAQRAAESAALKPVIELVLKRGEWKRGPLALLHRAGTGELEREHATLGAWTVYNHWMAERAGAVPEPVQVPAPEPAATPAPVLVEQPPAVAEAKWWWEERIAL